MTTITITPEIVTLADKAAQEILAERSSERMFTEKFPFELWVARNTDAIVPLSEIIVGGNKFYIGFKPAR